MATPSGSTLPASDASLAETGDGAESETDGAVGGGMVVVVVETPGEDVVGVDGLAEMPAPGLVPGPLAPVVVLVGAELLVVAPECAGATVPVGPEPVGPEPVGPLAAPVAPVAPWAPARRTVER